MFLNASLLGPADNLTGITILGWIALFALPLAGYAGAAVIAQRIRNLPPGPAGFDTPCLLVLWALGFGLRMAGLGSGRTIALAVVAAGLLAALVHMLRPVTEIHGAGSGEFRQLPSAAPPGGAWNTWKSLARASGDFQARLLLQSFYFVAIGPFSLFVLRADPLRRRAGGSSYWVARPETAQTIDETRKQG